MARNLIFITIALIAVVVAGPGERGQKGPGGDHKRGGPGGHHFLPPFFGNVSDEGKKEIGAVFKNEALTLAQVDTQIAALAEKYGVAVSCSEGFSGKIKLNLRLHTRITRRRKLPDMLKSRRTQLQ